MVHLTTNGRKADGGPQTPLVCPKCGNHRTQVVGITGEPGKVNVRCGACGAISTVNKADAAAA